jgi:hypothetical protein
MSNPISTFTLSCPCRGVVIEGDLVKVHGERTGPPPVGAYVGCKCGCLHRVHLVDEDAHLIALAKLTLDEQIEVYGEMGIDIVRAGCPYCDDVAVAQLAPGTDVAGLVYQCPECFEPYTADGRDGHELLTRRLTDDENASLRRQIIAESRARAFGPWGSGGGMATGSAPFGTDPFSPFGRG